MSASHRFTLMLPVLGLSALIGLAAFGQNQEKVVQHTEHANSFQVCAKACSDCQRACDMCTTHCAHQLHVGKKEHAVTLATCQDCATICAAASQILARGGPFAKIICEACIDACAKCAAECEKISTDSHMKACAEECRRCEKACQAMLKEPGK